MKDERHKPAAKDFDAVASQLSDKQAAHGDAHGDAHGEDPVVGAGGEKAFEYEDGQGGLLSREIPPVEKAQPDRRLRSLWTEADEIWERCQDRRPFRGFVAADYQEVYEALVRLQGRLVTVLEWGSGLGVITIMASNLGFEAYGIESESPLVDWSRKLAEKYGPNARFVTGSFIPEEYEWNPECADDSFRTEVDVEPAYDELDMELRDFDLVYAFPWPDELPLYHDIMRQCGGENSLFLTYDAREGIWLDRIRRRR